MKSDTVKFLSKCPNQILTMVPNRKLVQDGVVIPVSGKRIGFTNGEFETKDKKEIEFIRSHRLFGFVITEVGEQKDIEAVVQGSE